MNVYHADVVGCSSFTAKKTGKPYVSLFVTFDDPNVSGKRAGQILMGEDECPAQWKEPGFSGVPVCFFGSNLQAINNLVSSKK